MPETIETAPSATTLGSCCVCEVKLIGGTAVGLEEKGSGPARTLYACAPCVKRHNLLPLDEQTHPVGDGRIVFRGQ
jgi:hypothetical protein